MRSLEWGRTVAQLEHTSGRDFQKPLNLQTARHPDISNHSSVQWHTKHMSLAKNADASDNQTITDISDRHALQTD